MHPGNDGKHYFACPMNHELLGLSLADFKEAITCSMLGWMRSMFLLTAL